MIAQVVAPGSIGGVETVVSELLLAAHRSGQRSVCLALLPPHANLPAALQDLVERGVDIVRVSAPHRAYLQQYRALKQALQTCGASVVHSHGYHADVLASFAARALSIPHVATLHGFVGSTRRGRAYEWLQLRSLRRAAAVIAVAQSVAHRCIDSGVSKTRVHVIANAAPTRELLAREQARAALSVPHEARAVAWIGRLSAEKEPLAFVELVRRLQVRKDTVGVLLGDGPLFAEARQGAATLAEASRLLMPGAVVNAGALLRAFDVLVVTSRTEGTPMVVLEAMRAGVPVVSTAVGGVPAMLGDGAGVLVPYGDGDGLLAAVSRVLDDPVFAASLAEAGFRRVETAYDSDAWWRAHGALYAQAISRSDRG